MTSNEITFVDFSENSESYKKSQAKINRDTNKPSS